MEFFTLRELTKGKTVDAKTEDALVQLVHAVLDPWRRKVGRLRVNSGWRSVEDNRRVGGEPNSQHVSGEAADVTPLDADLHQAFSALDGLPFDQAIIYGSHIHVSYGPRNRGHRYRLGRSGEKKYVRI